MFKKKIIELILHFKRNDDYIECKFTNDFYKRLFILNNYRELVDSENLFKMK